MKFNSRFVNDGRHGKSKSLTCDRTCIPRPLEFPQKSDKITPMAQKNPPEQHAFLATALERELLALIGRSGLLTAEEIVGNLPNPAPARNALEGCLAKHFVAQDAAGHLVLTESGRKQI